MVVSDKVKIDVALGFGCTAFILFLIVISGLIYGFFYLKNNYLNNNGGNDGSGGGNSENLEEISV